LPLADKNHPIAAIEQWSIQQKILQPLVQGDKCGHVDRLDYSKFVPSKPARKKGVKHRTLVDADHGIYLFPFNVAGKIERESKFQAVCSFIAGNGVQPALVQFVKHSFFLA
jgi:hypothetical protein